MPSVPAKTYHPRWGWLCMFLGLYPIAFALKLFPTGDTTGYAPMWIIFLVGLVFVITGTFILVKRHSRINTLLATSILFMLGAISVWVALFSPTEWFVGGFTALSEDQNIVLARWMFGVGAIASFIMSGYGIQKFLLSLIHPQERPPHLSRGKAMPPRPSAPRSVKVRQKGRRRVRPNILEQLLYPGRYSHPSRPYQSPPPSQVPMNPRRLRAKSSAPPSRRR